MALPGILGGSNSRRFSFGEALTNEIRRKTAHSSVMRFSLIASSLANC
jgi:hypothetical protein